MPKEIERLNAWENEYIERRNSEKKPTNPALTRFLAYAHLVTEDAAKMDAFNNAITASREQKNAQLKELEERPRPEGVSRRDARDLIERAHKVTVRENSERIAATEKEFSAILNGAILDFFSVENSQAPDGKPLIANNFPKLLEEAKETDRDRVDNFLKTFTDYLGKTTDYNLFLRYAYRKSRHIIGTAEDGTVLKTALSVMGRINLSNTASETPEQLHSLGDAYFNFLRHKISILRNSFKEDYPYLGLVYDIYTASVVSGDMRLVNHAFQTVDTYLGDLSHSYMVSDELGKLGENYGKMLVAMLNSPEMSAFVQAVNTGGSAGNRYPVPLINFILSPEQRLVGGFLDVYKLEEKSIIAKPSGKVMGALREQMVDLVAGYQRKHKSKVLMSGDELVEILPKIPIEDILTTAGFDATLSLLVISFKEMRAGLIKKGFISEDLLPKMLGQVAEDERDKKIAYLKELSEKEKIAPRIRILTTFFSFYPNLFWLEDNRTPETVDKENDYLWGQVLDNKTWFISPRGDRFLVETDPELRERAIESIVFGIDRNFPKEHKVRVKFEAYPDPIEFRFTADRTVLLENHEAWSADPRFKQDFANLVLRRLYFITSGALKEEKPLREPSGGGGAVVEFRRAHYNTLKAKRYKMEYRGAVKRHAQEMLEIYGEDIFKEMEKRWTLGTLDRRFYLTFTKEVAKGLTDVPNEITYQPELVKFQ